MKTNIILYIGLSALLLPLSSCKDDFDPSGNLQPSLSAHYLRVSETTFDHYTSSAFTESFNVESFETAWKFSDVANWISLSPQSGNASASITMNVQANESADNARTAIFYLQSNDPDWDFNRALSVSQAKATPTLSTDETALTFGGATGQQSVKITSNCTWSSSSSESWISVSEDVNGGKLTISVSANPLDTYRNGYVYVSYGGSKSASIRITQSPSSITASETTLQYENVASKYEVLIQSEAAWTSTVSDSWIQITPQSGDAGSTTVSIEVTPNTSVSERSGYVTIKTGTTSRLQIAVKQRGIYIEATPSLEFSSIVESKKISISSNTDWEVISAPNWLTLSSTKGKGNTEITVTSTENPNTTNRKGEIVIGQIGLNLEAKVSVTQLGKTLSTDATLLEFTDKAGTQTFNLSSDASWTSTKSVDWFSMSPLSGNGNAVITVSAQENTTTEERTGTIVYNYADKSSNVNVHQLAKYMTIDNQAFDFDSKGGSHTIELSTNDSWTASIEHDVTWLKLSKTSGTGNAVITLTAEDNPSVNVRSTVVTINSQYSQSIRILVSQKPRLLSVSSQSILFFANGGTSEVVSIDTDGTYEIKGDASWFTINKGSGNTFTVYATKNSTNDMRRGKITITLTDLTEGTLSLEISVMQAGEGGSFIINPYPDDSDWNYVGGGSLTVTIKGYTSDKNWDSSYGGLMTVKITGFTTDKDWNINDSTNCRATITRYGADQDWNNSSKSSGNFNNSNYSSDNNWNN